MPPRYKKKICKLPEPSDASATSMTKTSEAIAGNNSQCGFIKLPSELHLMILSVWPTIPDAEILANPTNIRSSKEGPDYLGRFHVLLALSQTCRALRDFYLTLCWERLQSCILSGAKRHWYQDLGIGVEIQSKGLMRKSPQLRPLVR